MPRPDPPTALGAALRARGLTATQIGRALHPEADAQTAYRTGQRILDGERDPRWSRVVVLAGALGLRIVLDGSGRVQVSEKSA